MQKYPQQIKVFLSEVTDEMLATRNFLSKILTRAGLDIFLLDQELEHEEYKLRLIEGIQSADCTIHILGHSYGKLINAQKQTSISEFQFNVAKKYQNQNIISKIFVWYPQDLLEEPLDLFQESFINSVRNNITGNMVYSNHDSPVVFVEDLRSIMISEKKENKDIKETDVFFVYNELDDDEAIGIIDLVSDIADVTKLSIIQNSTEDYLSHIANQVEKTKLLVIYYNRTVDWAISFVQQVWNKTGGASSKAQILFIGDTETPINETKIVDIPKVITLCMSADLIPLEIKVQLDKLQS